MIYEIYKDNPVYKVMQERAKEFFDHYNSGEWFSDEQDISIIIRALAFFGTDAVRDSEEIERETES